MGAKNAKEKRGTAGQARFIDPEDNNSPLTHTCTYTPGHYSSGHYASQPSPVH